MFSLDSKSQFISPIRFDSESSLANKESIFEKRSISEFDGRYHEVTKNKVTTKQVT